MKPLVSFGGAGLLSGDAVFVALVALGTLVVLAMLFALVLLARRRLDAEVREVVRALEDLRSGVVRRRPAVDPRSPMVLVADALNLGIDGVIMIGCKHGDDYQCHYVKGSELADYRVGNWGETLERLALEPERIKVVELAHNEFQRVPEILADFAETVDECGPNPFKGF